MSEVAVKIYETRKDIQRIHLKEPLYGKNGDEQLGIWVNSDTGQVMDHYFYAKMGRYAVECVLIGTKLSSKITGPFDAVEHEYCLTSTERKINDPFSTSYSKYFVAAPNVRVPIVGMLGLNADTVLLKSYIVIRFLDE